MANKNQVLSNIRDNLSRSYIFYIPKQFYHYIEHTYISNIIRPDMVNIIAYSNLQHEITAIPSEINGLEILSKAKLLSENIHQLLEQQEVLNESAFKHLYDEYTDNASIHWVFTLWMSKNVLIDLPETSLDIKSMFEQQAVNFDTHLDKLESFFGKKETDKNLDIDECLEMVMETVEELPLINASEPLGKFIKADTTKKSVSRKKKEPIITGSEARKFLLETVFNIDPMYLNTD